GYESDHKPARRAGSDHARRPCLPRRTWKRRGGRDGRLNSGAVDRRRRPPHPGRLRSMDTAFSRTLSRWLRLCRLRLGLNGAARIDRDGHASSAAARLMLGLRSAAPLSDARRRRLGDAKTLSDLAQTVAVSAYSWVTS